MTIESLGNTHKVEVEDKSVESVEIDVEQTRRKLAHVADRAAMVVEATRELPKTVHYDASGVVMTERDLQELREKGPEVNR